MGSTSIARAAARSRTSRRRLAELKADREQLDTLASDYARLIEVRDSATSQYDEAIAERTHSQARMDEIQRHLAALPRLAALRGIRERLAPLAALPEAPLGWANELPGLQKEEIELDVQTQALPRRSTGWWNGQGDRCRRKRPAAVR